MSEHHEKLAEAQEAYYASLEALQEINKVETDLLSSQPVDWEACDAASGARKDAREAAQAALAVYQAQILKSDSVTALIETLKTTTAEMKKRVEELEKTAKKLNALAKAADVVTNALGLILKFV